jgi:hypothetical protein
VPGLPEKNRDITKGEKKKMSEENNATKHMPRDRTTDEAGRSR